MIFETLTPEELRYARMIGTERRKSSLEKGLKDAYGLEETSEEIQLERDIRGAIGEMAFAKYINEYPAALLQGRRVQTKKAPDVGKDWEVKATEYHTGHLALHHDRVVPNFRYVLVIVDLLQDTSRIAGWVTGAYALTVPETVLKHTSNKRPACWIPQPDLTKFAYKI